MEFLKGIYFWILNIKEKTYNNNNSVASKKKIFKLILKFRNYKN